MFDFFRFKKKPQAKFPFTTDLHCHLIPGVDDGSRAMVDSIAMCEKMVELGLTKVICTPHRADETFENTIEGITPVFEGFKTELQQANIPLEVDFSFEYRLDEGFLTLFKNNQIRPILGKYILIENSFVQPLWNLKEVIYQIKLAGYIPILAHPERYTYYYQKKEEYDALHQQDCQFQVNFLSLAGCYGKAAQSAAMHLFEKGYVDYLGTDTHKLRHLAEAEKFLTSRAYAKLERRLDIKNDFISF